MEMNPLSDLERAYRTLAEILRGLSTPTDEEAMLLDAIEELERELPTHPDPSLPKAAILSSHREWENHYRTPVEEADVDLGTLARDASQQFLDDRGITGTEIDLLREDLLNGTTEYEEKRQALAKATSGASTNANVDSHLSVLVPAMELGRLDTYLLHLEQALAVDPQGMALRIQFPVYVVRAFAIESWEVDERIPVIERTLDIFPEADEWNLLIGMFDPCELRWDWVRAIEEYLGRTAIDPSNPPNETLRQVAHFSETFRQATVLGLGLRDLTSLCDREFDLMRLHDDLLLGLVDKLVDPSQEMDDCRPYFRGNRALYYRTLMNASFPDRDEIFGDTDDRPPAYRPIVTPRILRERWDDRRLRECD